MIDLHANPPRPAQALLRTLVRHEDADSIPGDLLEEYREVKRPSLGRRRADIWYITQVLSVLWRLIWPFVVAMAVMRLLTFPLPGWIWSIVPAPGVSLPDAMVFLSAAYYTSRRTRRVQTGMVAASATSLAGFAAYLAFAAIERPGLLIVALLHPFILVIVFTLGLMTVAFALVAGAGGVALARLFPSAASRARLG